MIAIAVTDHLPLFRQGVAAALMSSGAVARA